MTTSLFLSKSCGECCGLLSEADGLEFVGLLIPFLDLDNAVWRTLAVRERILPGDDSGPLKHNKEHGLNKTTFARFLQKRIRGKEERKPFFPVFAVLN